MRCWKNQLQVNDLNFYLPADLCLYIDFTGTTLLSLSPSSCKLEMPARTVFGIPDKQCSAVSTQSGLIKVPPQLPSHTWYGRTLESCPFSILELPLPFDSETKFDRFESQALSILPILIEETKLINKKWFYQLLLLNTRLEECAVFPLSSWLLKNTWLD